MRIDALWRRQKARGFLADEDFDALSKELGVPREDLEALAASSRGLRRSPPAKVEIAVCRDASCHLRGARTLVDRVRAKVAGLDGVVVREVSCIGRCDGAPAATVNELPVVRADVETLVHLAGAPEKTHRPVPPPARRFALDPYESLLDRYGAARALAKGGAAAATKLLGALKDGRLRGLGGAGFPVAEKWQLVRDGAGTPKAIVCNAHESEPGSFKDREILAQMPHLVIEGMILAGLVVGAEKAVVVVRAAYDPERESLEDEIASARRKGFLGKNACGSGRPFDVEVLVSPGGYVAGEETALLAALEDGPALPRATPPFPAERGLGGRPTLIHAVETFAMTPAIAIRGAAWWKAQGKRGAAGLKLFSVSGHVERPGVYEVPMGTTAGELLSLAGGVIARRMLKAFAPGGASSGFLPASLVDVPLDFEPLAKAGSSLGTGAVVYVAMGTDMVELGRNVTAFFRDESCGLCEPCVAETQKAVGILDDVLAGRAGKSALDLLPEMQETLGRTSICGLGRDALRPIASVVDRFQRDVLSHVGSGLIALADIDEK